jgi:hypothetical protein
MFQIHEKLKFHKSEILVSHGQHYVRGISVYLHWVKKEPEFYETYVQILIKTYLFVRFLRRVQDFVNLSLIGHFVGVNLFLHLLTFFDF